ncbi:MAG: T9SS type A sorting domain-containing protein [Bacteroidota bacterium]|nr:T9SS type A sorting domain-containing protein [Bacteroidota bacterium]
MKNFTILIALNLIACQLIFSQNFIKLADDEINDDYPGFMDALAVYYAIDITVDSLWIKIESHNTQSSDRGFVIAFDTNLVVNDGFELWQNNLQSGQANNSMKFDIAVFVYQTCMVPGTTFYEARNKYGDIISDLNFNVSFHNDHFAEFRFQLSRLSSNAEFNLLAGTGSFDITPGGSGPSDIIPNTEYMSIPVILPSAPILLIPENGTINIDHQSTGLKWETVDGVSEYTLEYGTNPDFLSNAITQNVTDTFVLLNNLDPNTSYFWHVKSYNGLNYGNWSPVFGFTTIEFSNVDEIQPKSKIKIYPNPLTRNLTIEGLSCCPNNYVYLVLYTQFGQMIFKQRLKTKSEKIQVNLPHLQSGKYIAEIKYAPGKSISKVILID